MQGQNHRLTDYLPVEYGMNLFPVMERKTKEVKTKETKGTGVLKYCLSEHHWKCAEDDMTKFNMTRIYAGSTHSIYPYEFYLTRPSTEDQNATRHSVCPELGLHFTEKVALEPIPEEPVPVKSPDIIYPKIDFASRKFKRSKTCRMKVMGTTKFSVRPILRKCKNKVKKGDYYCYKH